MTTYTLGLTRTIGHGRAFSQVLRPTQPAARSPVQLVIHLLLVLQLGGLQRIIALL